MKNRFAGERLARAVLARILGIFDDPDLISFGPLSPSAIVDIERFANEVLEGAAPHPPPPE